MKNHLMATLRDLRSKTAPMPLDRAKAVAEVATVLVNTAKVQVEYLKVTQKRSSPFFDAARLEDKP
ncbi:hypothetical protein [Xenophilus sp.]|uniref:hypothetical protein n=1 Tax=Xenophilus sp. TaxID=1873499 RepID=UPI0037DC0323